MISTLINKARNLVVEITMCSNGLKFFGKVIEHDAQFVEVVVMVKAGTREFATDRAAFRQPGKDWVEDRILININDISMIT